MKTTLMGSLVLVLVGCSQPPKPQPVPLPGRVISFVAAPSMLSAPGEKTTLKWETADATSVSLEQVGKGPLAIDRTAGSGSLEVTLAIDSLFVLSARGAGGTDSVTAFVKVKGGAQSGMVFDAVPRMVTAGGSTTLVWSAPGATAVTIQETGGAMIELGGQLESGSVRVTPGRSTSYELNADGRKLSVEVAVGVEILSFTADPGPLPGQMVTLKWETRGASRLTLTREGVSTALLTETDAQKIRSGTFSEGVPATAPVDGLLTYKLQLEQGTLSTTRTLVVRIGGSAKVDQLRVPDYVRIGGTLVAQWKTSGGERLELWVDGVLVYLAPDAATVADGNLAITAGTSGTVKVKVKVSNSRGSVAELEKTTAIIGAPVLSAFTSDKQVIAAGGSPVVLSWNVTNARHLTISESGVVVSESIGPSAETGMATVFPNRASTTYTLNADNGAGETIAPASLNVTVTTPGGLVFGSKVPGGGTSLVTGHTITGGTTLVGLPNVKKNAVGDAFIDISSTGMPSDVTGDSTPSLVDIGPFVTRLFGHAVSSNTVSISPDGFLVFSASTQAGPLTPSVPIGTQLFPLAIAPLLKDQILLSDSRVFWQVDTIGDEKRLIVQWTDNALYSDESMRSTYEAQIFTRGKVVLAYSKVNATSFGFGVVNSTETETLAPSVAPVAGDVFTYFTEVALPAPVKVEIEPYAALVKVPMGWVEVVGSGLLTPGQIATTELNPRPDSTVTDGEWIELTNYTNDPFDLNGWVLDLGGGVTHAISTSVVIPANGRIVLAQRADLGRPDAGVNADYSYGTASPAFLMNDVSGSLTLTTSGTAYSKFVWNGATLVDAGISVQGDAPNPKRVYANGAAQASCPGTAGGTPGAANPVCFPYALTQLDAGSFEAIADAGTAIVLGDAGTSATDEKSYAVALTSPVKFYGHDVSTLYVGTNGWITATPTTLALPGSRTLPAAGAPNSSIAPFWADLICNPTPGAGLFTLRRDPDGSAGTGDEYTIVSWENWRVYGETQSLNFQVKFFDSGNIEYHYGAMTATSGTSHLGSLSTSWLEDRFGTSAAPINLKSSTAPGIHPNTGFRFSYAP
jgi:hypothetical protein